MKVRQHQEEHARAADEEKRRQGRERRAAIEACGLCDDFGWVLDVEPLKRCKHSTVTTNAGN